MTPSADLVGLADCPFCGAAAQVLLTTDAHNQAIVCNSGDGGCGARGPYRSNGIWARTAWNTRAELRALAGAEAGVAQHNALWCKVASELLPPWQWNRVHDRVRVLENKAKSPPGSGRGG
jgi:hypothetical protein